VAGNRLKQAWEYFKQTHEALEKLKKESYFILALENTPASLDYRRIPDDKIQE